MKEIDQKSEPIHIEFHDSSKSGHLDEVKVQTLLTNWKLTAGSCTFWVCGPPPMIDAMEKVLGKLDIKYGSVRSEKFTGY